MGQPKSGGDSSAVQQQMKNVQHVQASGNAFAAILADGSVVTWGRDSHGLGRTAGQGTCPIHDRCIVASDGLHFVAQDERL